MKKPPIKIWVLEGGGGMKFFSTRKSASSEKMSSSMGIT